MKAGFVDWIISTGANPVSRHALRLGMELYAGSPFLNDVELRRDGVIRIYDVLFDYDVLLDTDAFVRQVIQGPEFQHTMATDEFPLPPRQVCPSAREKSWASRKRACSAPLISIGVPIFTSSPGDSSIGMNVAAMALRDSKLMIDVNRDVNQTAAIVYSAKSSGRPRAYLSRRGIAENFMLQTEPQIQEVMGIEERGHDYFLQCTDARPDTGGLSGATPGEAVSWGKIDPDNLPDCVVCYCDSTITLPLITAYALSQAKPRKAQTLVRQARCHARTRSGSQYFAHGQVEKIEHRTDLDKDRKQKKPKSTRGRSGPIRCGNQTNLIARPCLDVQMPERSSMRRSELPLRSSCMSRACPTPSSRSPWAIPTRLT
jgi:deoxyhypusine synthase